MELEITWGRVLTQRTMKIYNNSKDIILLLLSITFIGDINDGAWSQRQPAISCERLP